MKSCSFSLLLSLICMLLPMGVHGSYLPVANSSFESNGLETGDWTLDINFWEKDNYSYSLAYTWAPTDQDFKYIYGDQGHNVALIVGDAIYQTLGVTIEANKYYALYALIGNPYYYDGIPGNGYKIDFYSIDLEGNWNIISADTNFDMRPAPGEWALNWKYYYVPEGSYHVGRHLGIRLWSYFDYSNYTGTCFDLISAESYDAGQGPNGPGPAVPIPGAVLLLSSGLIGIAGIRRKLQT